jgi:hypothetical protein
MWQAAATRSQVSAPKAIAACLGVPAQVASRCAACLLSKTWQSNWMFQRACQGRLNFLSYFLSVPLPLARPAPAADTPGLLDRAEEDRNAMERLTLACLQHLPTAVLFVADLTGECGTSVANQWQIRWVCMCGGLEDWRCLSCSVGRAMAACCPLLAMHSSPYARYTLTKGGHEWREADVLLLLSSEHRVP